MDRVSKLTTQVQSRRARAVNVVLGLWLFASAFVWKHEPTQQLSTWATAVFVVVLSAMHWFDPRARYGVMVASAWLIASAVVLDHYLLITPVHNAALGVLVFFFSLVPSHAPERSIKV